MNNLVTKYNEPISENYRNLISERYHRITKIFNKELWDNYDNDDTSHSLYVGSYGRNTAIDSSDIDILLRLPNNLINRFKSSKYNGQSYLLQVIRETIKDTYPKSIISADGQIVKIDFSDQIRFELLPVFLSYNGLYMYPDSNKGGNWKYTNPKSEQKILNDENKISNGLLKDTCKHLRFIRDNYYSSYHLSGILIDTFVYHAIKNNIWQWTDYNSDNSYSNSSSYEFYLLNYYNNISVNIPTINNDNNINMTNEKNCLKKILEKINDGIE